VLERATVAAAARLPRFFDECRVDWASVDGPVSSQLLARLCEAGFLVGVWRAPSEHGFPVYWCHVVEGDGRRELAPLPGEGSGCDFTHDAALSKALLEAYQARVTAIAGAREDITRRHYPERHDRERLTEWRRKLSSPGGSASVPREEAGPADNSIALERLLRALDKAGAKAAVVVPLFAADEPPLHVLRLVAPPLRHGGDHR
jgi:ribosomal protein S12 methylthiotransferase accessory factor